MVAVYSSLKQYKDKEHVLYESKQLLRRAYHQSYRNARKFPSDKKLVLPSEEYI